MTSGRKADTARCVFPVTGDAPRADPAGRPAARGTRGWSVTAPPGATRRAPTAPRTLGEVPVTGRYSERVVIMPVRGEAGGNPALTRNREPSSQPPRPAEGEPECPVRDVNAGTVEEYGAEPGALCVPVPGRRRGQHA